MPVNAPLSPDRIARSGIAEIILWSSSFAIVSTAFAAVIYGAANWEPARADTGAPPPAVMIEFAPLPTAPVSAEDPMIEPAAEESLASDDVPAPQPPQEPIAEPEPIPDPEPIPEPEPAESPDPEPVQAEPEPQQETPAPELEPAPETPIEAERLMTETVDPVPDEPLAAPEPSLIQRVEIPQEVSELRAQTPRTIHTPPPAPPASAPSRRTAPAATQAQPAPTMAAPETIAAPPAPTISPERWQSQLFAHLNRYKQYPPQARARREQGTTYVRFSIDASGRVLSSAVARSSGYPILDEAVIALLRTASPFPPPPAELGDPLSLTIPIEFTLR